VCAAIGVLAAGCAEGRPRGVMRAAQHELPPPSREVTGELLVANFVGDRVTRHDARTGAFLGAFAATPELDGALGMDRGPDGRVYVASEESNRVLRFDARTGAFLGRFVWDDPDTPGDETGGLQGPGAVLFGADGLLYVSSFDGDAVLRYDGRSGAFVDEFVAERAGGLDGPDAGMVWGPDGDLYVPGFYNHAVLRYDGVTGEFKQRFTPADGALLGPRTLIFSDGALLVSSERRDTVVKFDARTGDYLGAAVAPGAGGLAGPAGMALLPDGALAVVSVDGDALLRFAADGRPDAPLVAPGSGALRGPTHLLYLRD
jgi:DNA-binding beta-propeller fold protein YncE